MTAEEITARLRHRAVHAFRVAQSDKPPLVRAVAQAYLEHVHPRYQDYLIAAFRNTEIRRRMDGGPFDLHELISNVPARWDFSYTWVPGTVSDVLWCVAQYRWVEFTGVSPLAPDAPIGLHRIPIMHKENSRFRKGYERRMALKHELRGPMRSLVGYARKMTKTEFLEQFHAVAGVPQSRVDRRGQPYTVNKLLPEITDHQLLQRTGYTPAQFWREVHHPGSHVPRRPQLELL